MTAGAAVSGPKTPASGFGFMGVATAVWDGPRSAKVVKVDTSTRALAYAYVYARGRRGCVDFADFDTLGAVQVRDRRAAGIEQLKA